MGKTIKLSKAQRETWIYIALYTHEHKCPPTVLEIARHFNMSRGATYARFKGLMTKGYIVKRQQDRNKAGAYRLFVWPTLDYGETNFKKWQAKEHRRILNQIPHGKKKAEAHRVWANNKRARDAGNAATLTLEEWGSTLSAFDYKCAYCDNEFDILEHIIPVQLGGGTTVENCVPSCFSCNIKKASKVAQELGVLGDKVTAAQWKQLFWVSQEAA